MGNVKNLRVQDILNGMTIFPSTKAQTATTNSTSISAVSPVGPSVIQLSWSPLMKKVSPKSLLTILVDTGSLDIYQLKRKTWIKFSCITEGWLKHCRTLWKKKDISYAKEQVTSVLKERAYKMKITAFVWGNTPQKKQHIYSYLYTSNMVGDIIIWSVRINQQNMKTEISVVCTVQTDLQQITSISFESKRENSGILVASSIDGTIHSTLVTIKGDGSVDTGGNWYIIWNDRDKIALVPNSMMGCPWTDNSTVFVISKGSYLIVLHLNNEGLLINMSIHDSGDTLITGFAKLSESRVIFTTRHGNIMLLNIGDVEKNIFEPSTSKMREQLRSDHYACYGISLSRSKVMAVLAYSVCKSYDHLAIREPSQMVWCSLQGAYETSSLINEHDKCLSYIWDAIDLKRIEFIQGNEETRLLAPSDLDVMDIVTLKKHLWLTRISSLNSSDNTKELETEITKIVNLVFSHYVFKRISNLLPIIHTLSEFTKLSLFLMSQWLDFISKNMNSYEMVTVTALTLKEQMDKFDYGIKEEKCIVCNEIKMETLTSPTTSLCKRGHSVPRCCLSLIQCDALPYYHCQHCGSIAHASAVSEDLSACVYCDIDLRLEDNFIVDDEL